MTTQDKHRRDFWTQRFTEYLHTASEQGNEAKAKQAKFFADACLVQYDVTFNQTAKEL
jgi:hypothetical protein